MKHIAYNMVTFEVICTDRVNHLKRCVKRNNQWNLRNGYTTGYWVFAHMSDKEATRRKLLK